MRSCMHFWISMHHEFNKHVIVYIADSANSLPPESRQEQTDAGMQNNFLTSQGFF